MVTTAHVQGLLAYLQPHMTQWGSGYLMGMEPSGSIAKGTAVATGTDTDFFLSLSSSTPGTLKNAFDTLFTKCQQLGLSPRRQNVSIGTSYAGHKIDLVPGRRQGQYGKDHSLYKSKTDSWTQTNVQTHINYVRDSGRTQEIKLTKIWRDLHKLDFPSFYLEMAVIDCLTHFRRGNLSDNFWEVLRFLCQDFEPRRYVDPSNTNNIISDDLSLQEKRRVAQEACQSRQQRNWEQIVW